MGAHESSEHQPADEGYSVIVNDPTTYTHRYVILTCGAPGSGKTVPFPPLPCPPLALSLLFSPKKFSPIDFYIIFHLLQDCWGSSRPFEPQANG